MILPDKKRDEKYKKINKSGIYISHTVENNVYTFVNRPSGLYKKVIIDKNLKNITIVTDTTETTYDYTYRGRKFRDFFNLIDEYDIAFFDFIVEKWLDDDL